jgi:hypothetical protein
MLMRSLKVRRLISVALFLIAQLSVWSVDANEEDVVEYGADVVRANVPNTLS